MGSTLNIYGPVKTTKSYGWLYKLLLFVSFLWANFYIVVSTSSSSFLFSLGNVFDSGNFSSIFFYTVLQALVSWLIFELILFIYRLFLSFKIYSFIVPVTSLKNESRLFFAIKNIFYGIIINMCFAFPYLYDYLEMFNLILVMVMLIIFAYHLQKKYSQPIISHFVFKCFCYPVFVYELLVLIFAMMGVLVWWKIYWKKYHLFL